MTARAFCAAVYGLLVEQHGYEATDAMLEPVVEAPVSLEERRAAAAALGGAVSTYG